MFGSDLARRKADKVLQIRGNPKATIQGSGRHISLYRCSSAETVRCPWPEKPNGGYADTKLMDTASKWATRNESEERKSAYAQTMCSFYPPFGSIRV